MITLPEHVLSSDERGGWDGESIDQTTGLTHDNTETEMSWAEHQRIVCNARGLLASNIVIQPSAVRKAFEALKSGYTDQDSRSVIRVTKGIHQPLTNPHIQLRMITTYYQQGGGIMEEKKFFHLDLSAVDTPQKTDAFQWTPAQFSYRHTDGMTYNWPINAPVVIKKSGRRNSVSAEDLQAHVRAVQEGIAKAAAEAKAKKFNDAWSAFAVKHKITNNPKYKTTPSKFKAGTTTLFIISNTEGKFHAKYDPTDGTINKTNPQGVRL